MSKFAVSVGQNRFEIQGSLWSAWERVRWNGETVSEKRSICYVTAHSFTRDEPDGSALYEVNSLTGWLGGLGGYIVRRNGLIVAHKP